MAELRVTPSTRSVERLSMPTRRLLLTILSFLHPNSSPEQTALYQIDRLVRGHQGLEGYAGWL